MVLSDDLGMVLRREMLGELLPEISILSELPIYMDVVYSWRIPWLEDGLCFVLNNKKINSWSPCKPSRSHFLTQNTAKSLSLHMQTSVLVTYGLSPMVSILGSDRKLCINFSVYSCVGFSIGTCRRKGLWFCSTIVSTALWEVVLSLMKRELFMIARCEYYCWLSKNFSTEYWRRLTYR